MAGKAVFLDRDNTVIEDPGYISDPQVVKLLPGVELAIKSLAQAGYKVVVVTNQSGVARGLLTEEMLERIHTELRRQLGQHGAHLDGVYYCPFHPEGTVEQYAKDSDLRKPKPGMLLKAAQELDIDVSASWMVGDSARDIEAGQRAGCRTVRVRAHQPSRRTRPGGRRERPGRLHRAESRGRRAGDPALPGPGRGGPSRPGRPRLGCRRQTRAGGGCRGPGGGGACRAHHIRRTHGKRCPHCRRRGSRGRVRDAQAFGCLGFLR